MRLSFVRAAALALIALAAPAAAQDTLSPDEAAAIDARIRAYLLENPEVIVEAMEVLEARRAEAEAAGDATLVAANAEALFEAEGDLVMGNPEGDVTIVEFADYRCGYCKAAQPRLAELMEGDGNIRLVLKEFPILGPESLSSARIALAAGRIAPDRYAAFHDALMAWRGEMNDAVVYRIAGEEGIDADALRAEVEAASDAIDAQIRATYDLARALGIQGTPSFVIGDSVARGLPDLEALRAMVAEAREQAG